MKKIATLLGAFLVLISISCEGPTGPPGIDGANGENGLTSQVFELENVDFGYDASTNLFSYLITFSDFTSFEVLDSDAVLVYRYDGSIEFNNGEVADAWSLIPQNFFLDQGTIQYSNAHTYADTELFIDGNFDLSNLDPAFTDNQIFRVVIVPGSVAAGKMDVSNINSVLNSLGISEENIKTYTLD